MTTTKPKYALFIISFNRLEVLQQAMKSFVKIFEKTDIYVIDKGSTYGPLLNWYDELKRQGINIIYSEPMTGGPDGVGGLNDLHLVIDKFRPNYDYYAVTDPDICLAGCDSDILEIYRYFLDTFPDVDIVGPMLRIDDIPNDYPAREWCYKRHVEQFWRRKPTSKLIFGKEVYFQRAKIDSTFGLLRGTKKFERLLDGIRLYNPYEARHLDWYIIPEKMTEDQLVYMSSSNSQVANWGAKHFKRPPLHTILLGRKRFIYTVRKSGDSLSLEHVKLKPDIPNRVYIYNFLVKIVNAFDIGFGNITKKVKKGASKLLR